MHIFRAGSGRSAQKKGYIGPVSTKTHSGDPDGTGGFGGFLGSGRFLALKFRFYEKFHRQNWLEIVGRPRGRPKQCFCFVFVLFCVLFLLVLVVLVVVLVLLGVVFLVPVAVARCATCTYTKTTPRSTKTTTRTTQTNKNKTKNKTKTKQKHCLGRPGVVLGWFWRGNFS